MANRVSSSPARWQFGGVAVIADAASVKAGDPSTAICSIDCASSVTIPTPDAAFIIEVGSPGASIPNAPDSLPGLPLP